MRGLNGTPTGVTAPAILRLPTKQKRPDEGHLSDLGLVSMEVRSDSDCASGQTRSVCFRGIFLEVWNLLVRRFARAAAFGVLMLGLGAGGMLTERTKAAGGCAFI